MSIIAIWGGAIAASGGIVLGLICREMSGMHSRQRTLRREVRTLRDELTRLRKELSIVTRETEKLHCRITGDTLPDKEV